MEKVLEFYFSFRSPYSYLAIARVRQLIEKYNLDGRLRIVRPLAMREPHFFEKGRPQFVPYLIRDFPREAQRLGIKFGMPDPDPIIMDMQSGKVDAQQPHMQRLLGLGVAANHFGKGLVYADYVSQLIWGGEGTWNEPGKLESAAREAGLDHEQLSIWANDHHHKVEEVITNNEAEQLIHHWGVPLMVLDGEPFFGQDRLDTLEWRLQK